MADLEVTPYSKIILLAKRWPSELKLYSRSEAILGSTKVLASPADYLWSRTTQLLTEAHIEWLAAVVGSTPTYELHCPANDRSTHWMASSCSASIEEVHLLINFTTQLIADAYIEVGTTPLMNSHQPAIIQLK